MRKHQFYTIAGILCFISGHQITNASFFLSCVWTGFGLALFARAFHHWK